MEVSSVISLIIGVFGLLGGLYAFLSKKDSKDVEHSKDIANMGKMLQTVVVKLDELRNTLIEYEKKTEVNTNEIVYIKESLQRMKADNALFTVVVENQKTTAQALQKIAKLLEKHEKTVD